MRSLAPIAILIGSYGVQAQSLAEHAAAASGATIGTAAGKPVSDAITKIFGQVQTDAQKAAKTPSKPLAKTVVETPAAKVPDIGIPASSGPAAASGGRSASHRRAPRSESTAYVPVPEQRFTIVPVEPPAKQATAEELA